MLWKVSLYTDTNNTRLDIIIRLMWYFSRQESKHLLHVPPNLWKSHPRSHNPPPMRAQHQIHNKTWARRDGKSFRWETNVEIVIVSILSYSSMSNIGHDMSCRHRQHQKGLQNNKNATVEQACKKNWYSAKFGLYICADAKIDS